MLLGRIDDCNNGRLVAFSVLIEIFCQCSKVMMVPFDLQRLENPEFSEAFAEVEINELFLSCSDPHSHPKCGYIFELALEFDKGGDLVVNQLRPLIPDVEGGFESDRLFADATSFELLRRSEV